MTSRLAPAAVRALCTSARCRSVSMKQAFESGTDRGIVPSAHGYSKFRELQNEFNAHPDKLVWQKRGLRDAIPYQLTNFLCVLGLVTFCYTLFDMSFTKKAE